MRETTQPPFVVLDQHLSAMKNLGGLHSMWRCEVRWGQWLQPALRCLLHRHGTSKGGEQRLSGQVWSIDGRGITPASRWRLQLFGASGLIHWFELKRQSHDPRSLKLRWFVARRLTLGQPMRRSTTIRLSIIFGLRMRLLWLLYMVGACPEDGHFEACQSDIFLEDGGVNPAPGRSAARRFQDVQLH